MKNYIKLLTVILFLCSVSNAKDKQLFADIGNLPLINGDTLYNCKVGYRTFGELNKDSSNAIINPTWFHGTSEQLGYFIGPGKIIDSTNYFIIAVDAIGNGISTSPSNYEGTFPGITIRDMVNAEYLLITKALGLHKLCGAIGGSMGSMQVLEWVVAYPGFIEKAVPYVCTPKSTAYDLLIWNLKLELIDTYRSCGVEDGQINKILNMFTQLWARTPDYLAKEVDEYNFNEYLKRFEAKEDKIFTIDNYRAQLVAMINHNIYADYNNDIDKTVKAIDTDLFMIVSRTDHVLHPKNSIELAGKLGAKILILENNRGHLAPGYELERCSKKIAEFFDESF